MYILTRCLQRGSRIMARFEGITKSPSGHVPSNSMFAVKNTNYCSVCVSGLVGVSHSRSFLLCKEHNSPKKTKICGGKRPLSLSLFLCASDPLFSALLHWCLSHSLSLSLALPFSIFRYPLSFPRPSSIKLSFSLTFSVLGSDLD